MSARILLVEDSEAQAGITKEVLQRSGYEVVWSKDGGEKCIIVQALPDKEK